MYSVQWKGLQVFFLGFHRLNFEFPNCKIYLLNCGGFTIQVDHRPDQSGQGTMQQTPQVLFCSIGGSISIAIPFKFLYIVHWLYQKCLFSFLFLVFLLSIVFFRVYCFHFVLFCVCVLVWLINDQRKRQENLESYDYHFIFNS